MKIIYIHGFRSSGTSDKVTILKKSFPDATVIAPTLSPSPKEAISQLHTIISNDIDNTIVVGTSLGGFYAAYFACRYDVVSFIINPSLEPDKTLIKKIGNYKRYGSNDDYNFTFEHIKELRKIIKKMSSCSLDKNNFHFYISNDDEELKYDKLDIIFPERKTLKFFDNSGHRFSRFSEIIPDIANEINRLNQK